MARRSPYTFTAFAGAQDDSTQRRSWPAWGTSGAVELGDDETSAGIEVTPESALRFPAAYAVVNVLATDLASLPIKMYRRRADGGRDRVTDHPLVELLSFSPDGEMTSFAWRQAKWGHCFTRGGGFSEIVFAGGKPASVHLMDPCTTSSQRNRRTGQTYYTHSRGTLPAYRVLHFHGLGFDGLSGYAPFELAREAIGLGLAAEEFAASYFGNGSEPDGVFEHPNTMSEEAQDRFRKLWNDRHQGPENRHQMAILEEGMKFTPTTPEPEKSQLNATRAFQALELARILRLPPHKIGDYSQSHLANIEASNLDYLTTTLMPWCESAEQELNWKLLTREERRAGYYLEHDMRAFLRGDMKARSEYHRNMIGAGIESPDEARATENMNPIQKADPERPGSNHFVPLNMTPLDNAIGAAARLEAEFNRSLVDGDEGS